MAQIPLITNRQPLASQDFPIAPPAAYGAGTAREVGYSAYRMSELGQLVERQQIEAASVDASKAWADLNVSLADTETRVKKTSDYSNYAANLNEATKATTDEFENSLENYPGPVSRQYKQRINELRARQQIGAQAEQGRMAVISQRARGMEALNGLAVAAAKEPDPKLRTDLTRDAHATINGMVLSGALNEVEAVEWRERLNNEIKQKRVGYFATGLRQELDDLTNKAFRDPINAERYESEGRRLIDSAGADWLPDDKLAEAHAGFKNSIWTSAIKTRVDADPVGTLKELKAGKYDDKLNQQSLEGLTNGAEVEIDRRERKAEAERKEAERRIGKLVDDYKGAKMAGFEWAGNEAQLGRAVQGTEHEQEFRQVQQASKVLGQFNTLAPIEQERYLNILRQQPQTGESAKFYSTLQAAHNTTKAGLAKDPLGFAIKQRTIPDPGPLNLQNPVSLKARSLAAGIAEQRYGVPVSPFTDSESDAILAMLNEAPAAARVQVMQSLSTTLTPRQVQMFAGQMDKKGASELAQAFGISAQVPEAASRIVQGFEIKKANPKAVPTESKKTEADLYINERLSAAYKADPQALEGVRGAIYSAYAWASWQMSELDGGYNQKRMDNAITTVTGGPLSFNGETILPPRYGVTEKEMRDLVGRADYSNVGGEIAGKDVLRHGKLTNVGPGLYVVRMGGAPVFDKAGNPFILDLGKVGPPPPAPTPAPAGERQPWIAPTVAEASIPVY